jgi:hypothetical protein
MGQLFCFVRPADEIGRIISAKWSMYVYTIQSFISRCILFAGRNVDTYVGTLQGLATKLYVDVCTYIW